MERDEFLECGDLSPIWISVTALDINNLNLDSPKERGFRILKKGNSLDHKIAWQRTPLHWRPALQFRVQTIYDSKQISRGFWTILSRWMVGRACAISKAVTSHRTPNRRVPFFGHWVAYERMIP